jgi:hypothetical protein
MTQKSVAAKAHLKAGSRIAVVNPVPGIVESLGLPPDVTFVEPPDAQFVFLFASTRAQLETQLPGVVGQAAEGAVIWVFFRKGSKAAGLDMNRDTVWAVAERVGLRPIGIVSVDDTWSIFRLRRAA